MVKVTVIKNTTPVKVKNYITDSECKDEGLVGSVWEPCCDTHKKK